MIERDPLEDERSRVRDLLSVMSLPTLWQSFEPETIADSALQTVVSALQATALATLCLPLRQVTGEPYETVGTLLFYAAQLLLAGAVAMTLWSGYEFFRDVWHQRGNIRQSPVR